MNLHQHSASHHPQPIENLGCLFPTGSENSTVAKEDGDDLSTMNLYRQVLRIRREMQDQTGKMSWVGEPSDSVVHLRRPGGWEILMNMSAEDGVEIPDGSVLLASGTLEGKKLPAYTTVWIKRG